MKMNENPIGLEDSLITNYSCKQVVHDENHRNGLRNMRMLHIHSEGMVLHASQIYPLTYKWPEANKQNSSNESSRSGNIPTELSARKLTH